MPFQTMKALILGCGTSTGVPLIGCGCAVCVSTEPKNKRTRASALLSVNGRNILIDTSTDLRAQALVNNLRRIDAVLYTHEHADHLHGIDDLRSFNMAMGASIPCYSDLKTISKIREKFSYIFERSEGDGWKPELTLHEIKGKFNLFDFEVTPVEIEHGYGRILGFRVGALAYITDCSGIPKEALGLLKGVNVLILGALRQKPHPSHFSIDEAIEAAGQVGAGEVYLTHLGHNLDYVTDSPKLPQGVHFAYDGLEIDVP